MTVLTQVMQGFDKCLGRDREFLRCDLYFHRCYFNNFKLGMPFIVWSLEMFPHGQVPPKTFNVKIA